MNAIKQLENIGYRLNLAIDYTGPANVPLNVDTLLSELAAHKPEAILYLAERNNNPAHTRISEQYCAAITKGIQAGESPYTLLLQSIECISAMTGDSLFYTQNYENIKAIYGAGLSESVPLHMELTEVRQRLTMLTRPEIQDEPPDSRKRIERAIKSHRDRESQIINMMEDKN